MLGCGNEFSRENPHDISTTVGRMRYSLGIAIIKSMNFRAEPHNEHA